MGSAMQTLDPEAAEAVVAANVTVAELERLPDDGRRYDLLDGELISMSPAGEEHGYFAGLVLVALGNFVTPRRLGRVYAAETGFRLESGSETVLGPDVAFVRAERVQRDKSFARLAPDLAVEVRSPSDRRRSIMEKVGRYLAAGTPLVWLLEPAQRAVTVFAAGEPPRVLGVADVLDGGDVLPGFRLPLSDLFA